MPRAAHSIQGKSRSTSRSYFISLLFLVLYARYLNSIDAAVGGNLLSDNHLLAEKRLISMGFVLDFYYFVWSRSCSLLGSKKIIWKQKKLGNDVLLNSCVWFNVEITMQGKWMDLHPCGNSIHSKWTRLYEYFIIIFIQFCFPPALDGLSARRKEIIENGICIDLMQVTDKWSIYLNPYDLYVEAVLFWLTYHFKWVTCGSCHLFIDFDNFTQH